MAKVCTKCKEVKLIGEFFQNKKTGYWQSWCKECLAESARKTRVKHPERHRAANRKARLNNLEEAKLRDRKNHHKNKEKRNAYAREYKKANRFKFSLLHSRASARRKGHTPCTATVRELETAFTGRCAICGITESECNRKLHMDHDHETGDLRGFLCNNCNLLIGYAKDSVKNLQLAITYLEERK